MSELKSGSSIEVEELPIGPITKKSEYMTHSQINWGPETSLTPSEV
jgi:hypothetical protein